MVIPNFNYGHFLGEALSSVLEQTYKNFEVLVIDNNSSDSSESVSSSFGDNRISFHKFSNGGSIAASRNRGVELSRGEIIAFLDSDDAWFPNKLFTAVSAINSGSDFVFHDLKVQGKKTLIGSQRTRGRTIRQNDIGNLLMQGNPIATSSVVLRREVFNSIGGMDTSLDIVGVEDFDAWIRMADAGCRMEYEPTVLGYYRVHGNSISKSRMSSRLGIVLGRYLGNLTSREKKGVEALVKYVALLETSESESLNADLASNFLFVFRYGATKFKIRSIYLLFRHWMGIKHA